MTITIRDLKLKKVNLFNQATEIQSRADQANRPLTQEEQNSWNAIMNDWASLKEEVDRRERLEAMGQELNIPDSITGRSADPQPPQGGSDDPTRELAEVRSFLMFGSKGPMLRSRMASTINPELRALQADADAAGGYMVAPETFVSSLIKALDNQVFMRSLADVQKITNTQSLGQPYLAADPDDADWTSELGTGNEDSSMSLGKRELHPHPLAKRIKVSNKLLRLTPAAEDLVIARLSYKFGISMEKGYLTGHGANQPLGVFTASNDGISTGRDVSIGNTTTSIQTDGLKEVKYTLKGGYWPSASWIFHRDAVKQIAKLQTDDGKYIWSDSIVNGEPDRLLGFPVHMSEYAPNTFTTGLYVGILGNFKLYHIVDSLEFALQRLVELYSATNQTGFIGRLESDGMPVLEEAFVRVKLA